MDNELLSVLGSHNRIILVCLSSFMALIVVGFLVGCEEFMALLFDTIVEPSSRLTQFLAIGWVLCAAVFCKAPLLFMIFTWFGELLPLIGGFFFDWSRAALVAFFFEVGVIATLAVFESMELSTPVPTNIVVEILGAGGSNGIESLKTLSQGNDGTTLGILYGFLPMPSMVKVCIATLVLRVDANRFLIVRLPSAMLQAMGLAYIGRKSRILAKHAAVNGFVAQGIPMSSSEIGFGVVCLIAFILIVRHARRTVHGQDGYDWRDRELEHLLSRT